MTRRLLFVTYGGGHAHMVHPVVHELRRTPPHERGELRIEVLALPAATYTIRSRGIEPIGFGDFLDPARDADALHWGRELAAKHHSPTVGVALEDSIAYLGLSYKDLVVRHGEAKAAELLANKGRHAFLPITIMERAFDRIQPNFVVTSNSPRSEAAAIAVANQRGIGNLIMTDLFTGMVDYRLEGQDITFLNEVAREMFIADGLVDPSRSRLHLTGNPAFDGILARRQAPDREWIEARFPAATGRKLVLHADMPAWWDADQRRSHVKTEQQTLAELDSCYAACRAAGVIYLVRPHPSQNRALFAGWVAGRPDAFLAVDCDLHELLANVDLVLVRSTTVGLEAAMMGRRIVQLECQRHPDLPLARMGAAWGSQGFDSLAEEIRGALEDEPGLASIRERIGKILPSQPAAPKIAALILNRLGLASQQSYGGSP